MKIDTVRQYSLTQNGPFGKHEVKGADSTSAALCTGRCVSFPSVYLGANKIFCKCSEKQTRHNIFLTGYLFVSSTCLQGHVLYKKILKEIETTSGNLRNIENK